MKKLTFFIWISFILLLTACRQDEQHIDKVDLLSDFESFNQLPQTLSGHPTIINKANSTDLVVVQPYVSAQTMKLKDNFAYAKELLLIFNDVLHVMILENELQVGESYTNNNFTYTLSKDDDVYRFTMTDNDSGTKLKVATNRDGYYSGSYEHLGDDLEFTINGSNLTLDFYDADEASKSLLLLEWEDDDLKVKIDFEQDTTHYIMTSISDDYYSAILYEDRTVGQGSYHYVVANQGGYTLYESVYRGNSKNSFAGYHLHTLTNYTNINKIDETTYYVDSAKFSYLVDESNLFQRELRVMAENGRVVEELVLLLGVSDYNRDFNEIIALRNPFTSEHVENIVRVSNDLYDYWLEND